MTPYSTSRRDHCVRRRDIFFSRIHALQLIACFTDRAGAHDQDIAGQAAEFGFFDALAADKGPSTTALVIGRHHVDGHLGIAPAALHAGQLGADLL